MTINLKLKADWVTALRSGQYKQARRCLRDRHENSFCCLGVLADIQSVSWHDETPGVNGRNVSHREGGWLDEEFAGMSIDDQRRLSRMNDGDSSFAEIADYIEGHL